MAPTPETSVLNFSTWPLSEIGQHVEMISGVHIDSALVNENSKGRAYLTGPADFKGDIAIPSRYTEYPQVMCKAGDILVTVKGSGVGRTAIAQEDACISRQLAALRVPADERRFWLAAIQFNYDELQARAAASLIPGLSRADLLSLKVRTLPRSTRCEFADILDSADKSIRSIEKTISKLDKVWRGSFHEFLTGGGETLTKWRFSYLGEVSSISPGITLGREVFGPGTVELPYLRVANVKDGHIDTSTVKSLRVLDAEVDRYRLQSGDVLMTEGGDFDKLGRGAVWDGRVDPCLHQNHIFRVRADKGRILPEFLSMYSGSTFGRNWFTNVSKQSTNLASISLTQLKLFPVPCPPMENQAQIVQQVSMVKTKLNHLDGELAKLRAVKQGLINDLLTGSTRVQNPKKNS
jgi:type I restriction enzyme S subunit